MLEAIAGVANGLTLAELNQVIDSPKSSLLALLRPLVASGHLRHERGRYRLGPATYRFGEILLRGRQPSSLIRDALLEARDASSETLILATINRETGMAIYVECHDSPMLVRYTVPSGAERPLYCSAAGQALLAFQPEDWQRTYLAGATLKALTPATVTQHSRLQRRLKKIRTEGISISDNEAVPGAAGLAVPVHRPGGVVNEVLLLAGPSERIRQHLPELRALMLGIGHRLAAALGATPESPGESSGPASHGTTGRLPSPPDP